jgi:hypothetical protein
MRHQAPQRGALPLDPGVTGRQHFERRLGACVRIHVAFEYRTVRKFKIENPS